MARRLSPRWRTAWVVWSWLSLLLFALMLLVVPATRVGVTPWLWAYFALAVMFLLARTKTVPWTFVAVVFAVSCLFTPLIGAVEFVVAGLLGAEVGSQDASVLVAGPVEEVGKLVPLLVLALFMHRRAGRFSVVDWLLLGYAAGWGFQAVEDMMRRLARSLPDDGGGLLGRLGEFLGPADESRSGFAQYGFELIPGWSNFRGEAVFGGHHVTAALVAVGIGVALRLWRRLTPLIWLLPAVLLGKVVLDHVMYNATTNADTAELARLSGHYAEVTPWLRDTWDTLGNGGGMRALLAVLLVTAIVLDVRREYRVSPFLPPVPHVPVASPMAVGAHSMAARLPALPAAFLRTIGLAVAVVMRDLILVILAAARPSAGDGADRRQQWFAAMTAIRRRRELVHDLAGPRHGRRRGRHAVGARVPVSAASGLAALVLGVWAGAVLGPDGEPAGLLGVFLADLFSEFGQWWQGLDLVEQGLTIGGGLGMFTIGGAMGLAPPIGGAGVTIGAMMEPPSRRREPLPGSQPCPDESAAAGGGEGTAVADRVGVVPAERKLRTARLVARYALCNTPGETVGHALTYLLTSAVPIRAGGEGGCFARAQGDEPLARLKTSEFIDLRDEGLNRATERLGCPPREHRYAGFHKHLHEALGPQCAGGVPYTFEGYPDFNPHAVKSVEVPGLDGSRWDYVRANEAAGLPREPAGYVWHHVEDGRSMMLVARRTHEACAHEELVPLPGRKVGGRPSAEPGNGPR